MFEKLSERNRKQQYISRRKFWMEAGMGIGGLALLDLLSQDKLLGAECVAGGKIDSPLSPKPTHFKPRAKSVIPLANLDVAVPFHRHAVVLFQRRLVIEGVHVTDAAAHEQGDHGLCPRLEVGGLR